MAASWPGHTVPLIRKGATMSEEHEQRSILDRVNLVAVALGGLLVVAAAAVAVVIAVGGGSKSATPSTASAHHVYPSQVMPHARRGMLEVAVGDYWFKPSAQRLHAGVYRFVARNYGVVQHDVMVERTPIKMEGPGAPIDEAAPYGVDGLQPGMAKSTTIMLRAGRWEVFCSVAGHYQSGQHRYITVYGHMPRGMKVPKSMGMEGDEQSGMGSGMMGSS